MRSIQMPSRPTPFRAALMTLALFLLGTAALVGQAVDRSKRPSPTAQSPLKLPPVEVRKLPDGIEVAVMQDSRLPIVSVGVVLDVSAAVDPADKTGLGDFTRAMLKEGTSHRTADQIAHASAALGGGVGPLYLYTTTANLDSALALMADQLLYPAFPQAALDRLKADAVANLRRAKEDPSYLASSLFGRLVYGADHPYARQQTEESVAAITREDIVASYAKYIRPPNVRFVIVGDITPDSAAAKLSPYFGTWQAGTSGRVEIPAPAGPAQTTIYLCDRPASSQSVIWIGALGPRRDTPDYHAISVMNTILGGSFSSRINLNLREQHGYTYGAYSGFVFRRVPEVGAFYALAAVQSAKTDSAVIEFMRELRGIRDEHPIAADEFDSALSHLRKQLPLELETVPQRAAAIMTLLNDNLPLDYYETLSAQLAAVTRDEVQATARKYVNPERLAIVVVGDRAKIESALRAANVAPVVVVDLKGEPVESH